jgi:signal transduction histidine kinase
MGAALFEDRFTDARMRRTIPRYARLGGTVVAITAPLATGDPDRQMLLLGVGAVALITAGVLRIRDVIDRLPHEGVFGILLMYCVLIGVAAAVDGSAESPYRMFEVLPVTFTAVFFRGRLRYSMPFAATAIEVAVLGPTVGSVDISSTLIRLAILCLVSTFAAEVSDMLREVLRVNKAMHEVLEAASGNPLSADLAGIGLDAALSVVGWDAGGVLLVEDDVLRVVGVRGVSPRVLANYDAEPVRIDEETIAPVVVRTGTIEHVADVAETFGPDHILTREGLVAMAAAPISYHGERIGVLVVAHRTARMLDDRERDRILRVTEQLGLALGNASAYRRETQVAEQLRELNRRKDEFLANVSHELRTPAAVIKMVALTLTAKRDQLAEDQLKDMHETVERRASHLCELIDNLLDEAEAGAGSTRLVVETIEWRDALSHWAEIVKLQSGRDITMRLPTAPVHAVGDRAKLERVVTNLLSNAAKFSMAGTPILLGLSADDATVTVQVTDRGVGISEEQLPYIFDRFFQVDGGATRTVGGFGLGLSLVRHFVEAHGGRINVHSALGQGSTFTVTLPRAAAHAIAG